MENYDYYQKPKVKLFFDIETIPAPPKIKDTATKVTFQKLLTKDSNLKLTKKLEDYLYRQTAISGDFGRIFCIGYAINNETVKIIKGKESEILKHWWQITDKTDLFIGHNIMDFDLRFIFKRSIINKINPSTKHANLSFARYRNFPIYDTMREWEKWSASFIKLDTLAKILNLPSSKTGGIDGSQVYDFYLKHQYAKIYKYCQKDVVLTRDVYKRMIFNDYL
jgi:hypothetical protein